MKPGATYWPSASIVTFTLVPANSTSNARPVKVKCNPHVLNARNVAASCHCAIGTYQLSLPAAEPM